MRQFFITNGILILLFSLMANAQDWPKTYSGVIAQWLSESNVQGGCDGGGEGVGGLMPGMK